MEEDDREWILPLLEKQWGSSRIVTRGRIHDAGNLPGFAASLADDQANEPVGLITFRIENGECEIITLNSLAECFGIGSALVDWVKRAAESTECRRIWLITTNDNTAALRFYQKRGFTLRELYCNAVAQSRLLKPEIPDAGIDGIPLRDEIELEMVL